MRKTSGYLFAGVCLAFLLMATASRAEDWPQWRYDASRSASSPEKLPLQLYRQWVRHYPQRKQTWDDPLNLDLMQYDKVLEPIIYSGKLYLGFNDSDKVVALDLETGREIWTFYTDGPVRFAPCAANGKIYFTSDDGYLYCVDAATGTLKWKHRGGPSDRKALGNKRLINTWPARGGPVIRDDVVYFAASIWPFMGTFIHALDAETGEVRWTNDGTGSQYIKQPHSAPAFAGVAPQGALVATKNILLIPGGRSVPAAFDRATGKFLHFQINAAGKGTGGSFVAADETNFYVHTRLRGVRAVELKTGKIGKWEITEPVLDGKTIYTGGLIIPPKPATLAAKKPEPAKPPAKPSGTDDKTADPKADPKAADKADDKTDPKTEDKKQEEPALDKDEKNAAKEEKEWKDREEALKLAKRMIRSFDATTQKANWEIEEDATGDIIRAGDRLYAAGRVGLKAIQIPIAKEKPRKVWESPVDGEVLRLVAGGGKLVAVTLDGRIIVYGGLRKQEQHYTPVPKPPQPGAAAIAMAAEMVNQSGATDGYALWFGIDDPAQVEALVVKSKLNIIAVDSDKAMVARLRTRLDAAELYGTRASIHLGDPVGFMAPPYMAHLIITGKSTATGPALKKNLKAMFNSLRPYGGAMWLPIEDILERATLAQLVKQEQLEGAQVVEGQGGLWIKRPGPLPGAASWTHQYGDVANTIKSDDKRVKLPLGVLWWGGVSNMDVLPRHGHGPSEQVIGGRNFIQGMNSLSARDVYTGRLLWKSEFPDLGTLGVYYDKTYKDLPLSTIYNQKHIPGAGGRGTNYVATADRVYLVAGSKCMILDSATGKTLKTVEMPRVPGQDKPLEWAFVGVYGDVLLGGMDFANYSQGMRLGIRSALEDAWSPDKTATKGLIAFDRHTGKELWRIAANHSFLHNAIVAGGGRVYLIDRLPKSIEDRLKRRGTSNPTATYRILGLDHKTGSIVWNLPGTDVFGTWLGYSEERDMLLQAGARAPDRPKDEIGQGMAVYSGKDGKVVWKKLDRQYTGPCIIHNDIIITNTASYKVSSGAFSLLDGTPHMWTNPVTGKKEAWTYTRTYGCNTVIASEYLLTFRSGAAGFYDLTNHGGTGNFGGFKSSCTSNLVVAEGVLNAPDYTRTCTCGYQNQTSLAMVHMPDLDIWTRSEPTFDGDRVMKLGVNFGAPGDKMAEDGILWFEYPSAADAGTPIPVKLEGKLDYFSRHSSAIQGISHSWVGASGVRGATTVTLKLAVKDWKARTPGGIGLGGGADDAEEDNTGRVRLDSTDIELVEDTAAQIVGLRFKLSKIDLGTRIRRAYIQFTADETGAKPAEIEISAEETSNAPAFTARRQNLSSRLTTISRVTWEPEDWDTVDEAGADQRTPDLSAILQEIIDRPDWKKDNHVAFLFRGTGRRVAKSFESDSKKSARLYIETSTDPMAGEIKSLEPADYAVTLFFVEPDGLGSGERVFNVKIGDRIVLEEMDIARETGGSNRLVTKTITGLRLGEEMKIELIKVRGKDPVLSGVQLKLEE